VSLFVFEQAVLVERPVGGASAVSEIPRADAPAVLAERFGIEGVVLRDDGDLALEERA
jgi:hypothetical protein